MPEKLKFYPKARYIDELGMYNVEAHNRLDPTVKLPKMPFSKTIKKYIQTRAFADYCKKNQWHLSSYRQNLMLNEYSDWQKHYLPIDMKDKTVLDVGAGEGETALFYLQHGAKRVIAVEASKECYGNLLLNSKLHHIIPAIEPFDLSHLYAFNFDFMKMDIEGYEEILLTTELKKPAVIEVHGLQLRDKFKAQGYQIGLKEGYEEPFSQWTCYAYKGIPT